jgi:hypothetical protein
VHNGNYVVVKVNMGCSYFLVQVFFVLDTVVGSEWKVVIQKEARSRCVVVEVVEFSLGAHNVTKEENLVKECLRVLYNGNVLSRELGEEVPISEVERVNAGLVQLQDNDSELEEED